MKARENPFPRSLLMRLGVLSISVEVRSQCRNENFGRLNTGYMGNSKYKVLRRKPLFYLYKLLLERSIKIRVVIGFFLSTSHVVM